MRPPHLLGLLRHVHSGPAHDLQARPTAEGEEVGAQPGGGVMVLIVGFRPEVGLVKLPHGLYSGHKSKSDVLVVVFVVWVLVLGWLGCFT